MAGLHPFRIAVGDSDGALVVGIAVGGMVGLMVGRGLGAGVGIGEGAELGETVGHGPQNPVPPLRKLWMFSGNTQIGCGFADVRQNVTPDPLAPHWTTGRQLSSWPVGELVTPTVGTTVGATGD